MEIRQILEDKQAFLPLLLLGDEQEELIARYLDRSALFALYDGGALLAVCAVTEEGGGTFEIKNLAVAPAARQQGHGRWMIGFAARYCRARGGLRLLACTGDSPLTVPFYRSCGFREERRVKNYFPTHYDHPIREGGKLVTDQVVFSLALPEKKPDSPFAAADNCDIIMSHPQP